MAVRAVLVGGLVLLVAAVLFLLAQSKPRQAGSNQVPELAEVVNKRGPFRWCQSGEIVPADAAKLRLLVGTHGRPTPKLRVGARVPGGERVTAGLLPAGARAGHVDIPVRPVDETTGNVRVCVFVSRSAGTALYGVGALRLEWLRGGSESWFELLPTIAKRFGLGKANPFGPLLLPIIGLVLLAAWVGTIRLVLRELTS